jgi:hypothetical protein
MIPVASAKWSFDTTQNQTVDDGHSPHRALRNKKNNNNKKKHSTSREAKHSSKRKYKKSNCCHDIEQSEDVVRLACDQNSDDEM